VYASVDNGARAQVQIGEISGMIDFETDTIAGTINAPWLSDEVNIECLPPDTAEPEPEKKLASVLPNGEDTYACSWAGEWNIQRGPDVFVAYFGADVHWVANVFITNASIVASAEGDWFWVSAFSPDTALEISIYESKDAGAALLWEGSKATDRDGFAMVEHSDHSLDLKPGNYLTVSDGSVKKGLVLESITIDVFDVEQDFVAGTAPPGSEVVVVASPRSEGKYQTVMQVTADAESGAWTADFKTISFDITEEMRTGFSFAQVFDDDGDTNEVNPQ
jgi:hypothetical protein